MKTINKEKMRRLSGYFLTTFALFIIGTAAFAQQQGVKAKESTRNMFENKQMTLIAKPIENPGWIEFRDSMEIDPINIFTDYRRAFELSENDQMVVQRVQNDDLDYTHYRYQQYHKGVKIEGAEFIVHTDEFGSATAANGKLLTDIDMDIHSSISEENALTHALAHADGTEFLWNNEAAEQLLKEEANDPDTTYFPEGELVIQRIDMDGPFSPDNAVLTWKFEIRTGLSGESRAIFIDAHTGDLVNYAAISMSCDAGTGPTAWYGTRTFSTDQSGSTYILKDDCTGSHPYNLYTKDMNTQSSTSNATEYTDFDNNWISSNDQAGITSHWAMHRTRDYFDNVHNRSSWNGGSASWTAYTDAVIFGTSNNACWGCTGNSAAFGGGNTSSATDDWNTLDIVGHEFGHGVVQTTAGLVYSNQSGALNESFADIFGEMVEYYSLGTQDWLVGGDRGAIRSFTNPKSYGDPDTYLGTNWYSGTGDNGGVHTNSSVQNHWFYLLSEGGSGVNDNGDDFVVSGIGESKARAIAYRNLDIYLTSSSNYIDARRGALRAARDLYGGCSNEEIQTGKAWFAVGVGNSLGIYDWNKCGTYTSGFHQGINSIRGGIGCSTTVNATTSNVTFTAANYVLLDDVFTATASGSNAFVAYLEPCSYTRWKGEEEVFADEHDHDEFDEPATIAIEAAAGNDLTAYPNPFDVSTTISYSLFAPGEVRITVYDITGKTVQQLVEDRAHQAGKFDIQFNTNDLPAGPYMCQMVTPDETSTVKLIIYK